MRVFTHGVSSGRLVGLDVLRAFCWLAVLVAHTESGPGWIGRMGVGVFFAISGFLITRLVVEMPATYEGLADFYFKRFFRIGLPYLAYLVVALLVVFMAVPSQLGVVDQLPYAVSFSTDLFGLGTGAVLGHTWSICVEERFYLFWPLLVVLARKSGVRVALVLILVGGAWWTIGYLMRGGALALNLQQQAYWFLPWPLLSGAAVAIFRPDRVLARVGCVVNGVLVLMGLAAYVCFTMQMDPVSGGWKGLYGMGVVYGGSAGAFTFLVLAAGVNIDPLLEHACGRVCAWVGRLSYSAYLVHVPFAWNARALMRHFGCPVLGFVVAAMACLPAAWLFNRVIEVPSANIRSSLSGNRLVVASGAAFQVVPIVAGLVYIFCFKSELLVRFFSIYPR